MKKLLKLIKEYKTPALIFGIIIVPTILILIFNKKPDKETQIPPVVKETEELRQKGALTLIKTIPKSGETHQSLSPTGQIVLEFSDPIEKSSVNIIVRPFIDLEKVVNEGSPNTLYIWPKYKWQENTPYRLSIYGVKGLNGERLLDPITYIYKYEQPEVIEGGEGWMLDQE